MAAKVGGQLELQDIRNLKWQDVCPLSLGVSMVGDEMYSIISRGQSIPCERSSTFCTCTNFQTSTSFGIYEGEHSKASKNAYLGSLCLSGFRSAEVGEIPLTLTLKLDDSGVLTVIAESSDHKRAEKRISKDASCYSTAEVAERIAKAAREKASDDRAVAEDKNRELLRCFYENVISYIDAYYADIAKFLGSSNITAIKASAQQSLRQVATKAKQVSVWSEQQAYRSRFQPFISATGRNPRCLQ